MAYHKTISVPIPKMADHVGIALSVAIAGRGVYEITGYNAGSPLAISFKHARRPSTLVPAFALVSQLAVSDELNKYSQPDSSFPFKVAAGIAPGAVSAALTAPFENGLLRQTTHRHEPLATSMIQASSFPVWKNLHVNIARHSLFSVCAFTLNPMLTRQIQSLSNKPHWGVELAATTIACTPAALASEYLLHVTQTRMVNPEITLAQAWKQWGQVNWKNASLTSLKIGLPISIRVTMFALTASWVSKINDFLKNGEGTFGFNITGPSDDNAPPPPSDLKNSAIPT